MTFTGDPMMIRSAVAGFALLAVAQPAFAQASGREAYDALVAQHAAANGIPASLVHRVIVRESRYNPSAIGRGGAMGMMQIKHATARGMGYSGSAAGLLDANTNLTYAVRYLAGAYRAANGNADRAVAYYASGYYYAGKRQRVMSTTGQALVETDGPASASTAGGGPSVTSATHSRVVLGATPRMDAVH
jgi:soluble lytic murein transglycosylase-like protein